MKATTCGHELHHAKGLCRSCYNRAWQEAHPGYSRTKALEYSRADPEKNRAKVRAWQLANPEREKERVRRWKQENSDRIRAQRRATYATNPAPFLESQAKRRARKSRVKDDLTPDQWAQILDEFGHGCAYCPATDIPLQMEHMVPLSRGGHHTASNVVPACSFCNTSKGARTVLEWIGPKRVFHEVPLP